MTPPVPPPAEVPSNHFLSDPCLSSCADLSLAASDSGSHRLRGRSCLRPRWLKFHSPQKLHKQVAAILKAEPSVHQLSCYTSLTLYRRFHAAHDDCVLLEPSPLLHVYLDVTQQTGSKQQPASLTPPTATTTSSSAGRRRSLSFNTSLQLSGLLVRACDWARTANGGTGCQSPSNSPS
jgi:hypothetical protein